ncbi:MAG: hypothetical protein MR508_03940 [Lachnospiraceae bacterium]|nr:hypothetical protein [Lachnospiraceae bacterium]
MNIWYQKCLEYYASVPEYRDKINLTYFTEETALASIEQVRKLYEEEHFPKDPDYEVRMDRLMEVMQKHEEDSCRETWSVWLRYFVTMGNEEWKSFWRNK